MPVRALQTSFFGDHNIGLFAKAGEKLLLGSRQLRDRDMAKVADLLEIKAAKISIAGSELIGIFSAMNSNGLLLPKIASQQEIEIVKNLVRPLSMNVLVVGSDFTAIGNLVLCNDRGAVLSPLLTRKEARVISDCLGVECDFQKVAGLDNIGSCGIATNSGCLLHRDASEEELDAIQDILKVETDVGTANFGSPFVGSCTIANSRGVVAGASTTGFEMARMMEVLKLI
jgi:translation initiation factor 6